MRRDWAALERATAEDLARLFPDFDWVAADWDGGVLMDILRDLHAQFTETVESWEDDGYGEDRFVVSVEDGPLGFRVLFDVNNDYEGGDYFTAPSGGNFGVITAVEVEDEDGVKYDALESLVEDYFAAQ